MPFGDAVQKRPTVEQEIAKFKSFATSDGEPSDGKPTDHENAVAAVNTDGAEATAEAANVSANAQAADSERQQRETQGEHAEESAENADSAAAETPEQKAAKEAAKPHKETAQERINKAVKKQRATERELDAERGARAADQEAFERRLAALESGKKPDLTASGAGSMALRAARAFSIADWIFSMGFPYASCGV